MEKRFPPSIVFVIFFKENVSFLAQYPCTILLKTPRSNSFNLLNSSFLFGLFFFLAF